MNYRPRHRGPVIDRIKARALIETGLSNLHIADRLGCAPNTVPALKRELGFPVENRAHRGTHKLTEPELYQRKIERDRARSKRRYVKRRTMREITADDLDLFSARSPRTHPTPNAQRGEVPRGCSESETAGSHRVDSGVTPARRTVPQDGGTTTLADAKPHQCRFPTGGGHGGSLAVCGHPVATPGLSWCRAHAERCFQKRADLPAVPPVLRWTMRGALGVVA